MSAEQTSPTTEERIAFKRAELHRGHWCDDCATLARQQALTDAIAAVDDVRFQFAAFPGDGADGDGPLGQLMAAVIDTLTRLLRGET